MSKSAYDPLVLCDDNRLELQQKHHPSIILSFQKPPDLIESDDKRLQIIHEYVIAEGCTVTTVEGTVTWEHGDNFDLALFRGNESAPTRRMLSLTAKLAKKNNFEFNTKNLGGHEDPDGFGEPCKANRKKREKDDRISLRYCGLAQNLRSLDVRVTVENTNGVLSEQSLTRTTFRSAVRFHVLAIGMKYANNRGNWIGDAEVIAELFKEKLHYPEECVHVLRAPSKDEVFKLIDGWKKTQKDPKQDSIQPQDILIVYYSGHGKVVDDKVAVLTKVVVEKTAATAPATSAPASSSTTTTTVAMCDGEENDQQLDRLEMELTGETFLHQSELKDKLQELGLQRIVYLLDACFSGAAMVKDASEADQAPIQQFFPSDVTGDIILSATTGKQTAPGTSLFTKMFIKACENVIDRERVISKETGKGITGCLYVPSIFVEMEKLRQRDKDYWQAPAPRIPDTRALAAFTIGPLKNDPSVAGLSNSDTSAAAATTSAAAATLAAAATSAAAAAADTSASVPKTSTIQQTVASGLVANTFFQFLADLNMPGLYYKLMHHGIRSKDDFAHTTVEELVEDYQLLHAQARKLLRAPAAASASGSDLQQSLKQLNVYYKLAPGGISSMEDLRDLENPTKELKVHGLTMLQVHQVMRLKQ